MKGNKRVQMIKPLSCHRIRIKRCLVAAIVFLTIAVTCAFGEILGSKHDFSAHGWSKGQVCLVCHTPHNANQGVSSAPLWNHKITGETNFTLYDSESMDQVTGQPKGISRLCLSCHDGTVALDSIGSKIGTTKILPGQQGYIGTDLSDDHPISITWTHQTIIPYEYDEQCFYCHDSIGENPEKFRLPFYSYDGGVNYNVECSSCHDPHNKGDGTQGPDYMLRTKIGNSFLCTQCHKR